MPRSVHEALRLIRELRKNTRAIFVQVGANNGKMYDPLYPVLKEDKSRWIGLQIEPQLELFAQLNVLHADAPDWTFFNGVVATLDDCVNGLVTFCQTKTPGQGNFKTQGQLNGIRNKCRADTMEQVSRPCVSSWKTLLCQHGGPIFLDHVYDGSKFNVDFVQIDTEGHDFAIINMIDFGELKPSCIHYEHAYGSRTVRDETMHKLQGLGYTIDIHKGDTLACLVENKESGVEVTRSRSPFDQPKGKPLKRVP